MKKRDRSDKGKEKEKEKEDHGTEKHQENGKGKEKEDNEKDEKKAKENERESSSRLSPPPRDGGDESGAESAGDDGAGPAARDDLSLTTSARTPDSARKTRSGISFSLSIYLTIVKKSRERSSSTTRIPVVSEKRTPKRAATSRHTLDALAVSPTYFLPYSLSGP